MAKQTFTTGQVLTAAQVNSLQANDFNQTVSAKTASYVLVASDKGTRIEFNTSGSVTCTVNTGLFDAGDTVYIQNRGAGVVTITAGTATVNTSASLAVNQWEGGLLYFISASAAIWYEYASTANGDITGVTAGTGISGGGTSGDVTITNTMATAIDAKGDLVAGTADNTFARLAVGNNGETLVADSSATTGLRWQGNFAAGKNAFINGDMRIWQRGTSFTFADSIFTADRFKFVTNGGTDGTGTVSQQTFTPGSAPVAGYEGFYYLRYNLTTAGTSTQHYIQQNIEDVRTFAGQTVTWSFWAKADSARVLNPQLVQRFGTGGSAAVVTTPSTITLSTSWARYSVTATIPSVSGKTIGTGSSLEPRMYWTTASGSTIEFWGWQLEAGNTATAFQTATGTLAGELAACQRYYYRITPGGLGRNFCNGNNESTTVASANLPFPVRMRTNPTAMEQSGTAADYQVRHGSTSTTCNSVPLFANASTDAAVISFLVASGLTTGQGCQIGPTGANGYLAWSAEL